MSGVEKAFNKRLFKLKEWQTISEAASHLSAMFDEKVSEADILRFALAGHLKLSVYFVNHAYARCGVKLLTFEQWEKKFRNEASKGLFKDPGTPIVDSSNNHNFKIPKTDCYISISEQNLQKFLENIQNDTPSTFAQKTYSDFIDSIIQITRQRAELFGGKVPPDLGGLNERVETIEGIWDLPLIGGERLDVAHELQNLTGGAAVTLVNINGPFVEGKDGEICQIQERFSDKDKKEINNLSPEGHRKKKEKIPFYDCRNYYPADTLPTDSVLVVRVQALLDLQERLISDGPTLGGNLESYENLPFLDKDHSFYANELKVAVEAWTELYENNPPQNVPPGGHKKYITKWLGENHPRLSQRAKDRITTIINPNPKGGASPIS